MTLDDRYDLKIYKNNNDVKWPLLLKKNYKKKKKKYSLRFSLYNAESFQRLSNIPHATTALHQAPCDFDEGGQGAGFCQGNQEHGETRSNQGRR